MTEIMANVRTLRAMAGQQASDGNSDYAAWLNVQADIWVEYSKGLTSPDVAAS